MGFLIALLTLVLVGAVLVLVSAPLRHARGAQNAHSTRPDGASVGDASRAAPLIRTRADLEAAREAKYLEIRDAELDYRTGKLSQKDYEAIDTGLRGEAIDILDQLERVAGTEVGATSAEPAAGGEGAEA